MTNGNNDNLLTIEEIADTVADEVPRDIWRQPDSGDEFLTTISKTKTTGDVDIYHEYKKWNSKTATVRITSNDELNECVAGENVVYVRVQLFTNGTLKATLVPCERWPIDELMERFGPFETSLQSPEHDEPVEWNGNPQKRDDKRVNRRRKTASEDDIQGDKNDLLSGHL